MLNAQAEGLPGASQPIPGGAGTLAPAGYTWQYADYKVCEDSGLLCNWVDGEWEYNGSYAYNSWTTCGDSYDVGFWDEQTYCGNIDVDGTWFIEKGMNAQAGFDCIPYTSACAVVDTLYLRVGLYGNGAHYQGYWVN